MVFMTERFSVVAIEPTTTELLNSVQTSNQLGYQVISSTWTYRHFCKATPCSDFISATDFVTRHFYSDRALAQINT